MSTPDRLARVDGLFNLLSHLVADDFAGHPACAEVCAAYAVRRGEAFGVWGGTTPVERQEMRRVRRESSRQAAA
jgi:hypothetical protein